VQSSDQSPAIHDRPTQQCQRESWLLGSVLRQVVAELPEGGRALVVGHSPTTEAAVLGLAGQVVPPLGKGKGVLLVEDGGDYQVEPLD
jgi:hypothetical protein